MYLICFIVYQTLTWAIIKDLEVVWNKINTFTDY